MKQLFFTLTLSVIFIPFGISQDLPSYIPTDGLLAYYPFNGNANDESGNGHHGTVNGATLSSDIDGNIDKAYEFSHDGASFGNNHQSIYIPFHSDFQSENFTVSIWFKADSYGWDGNSNIGSTLFSKRENSSQPNQATYRIQLSSNFTRSEIGGPDGDDEIPCTADSNELNLGAWYHIASTYDGTTLKQYINGVKVSEINCDLSHNAISTSGIMLGQTWQYNGYWYHLDGKLDEFMVYNRSMTEQEMENYYVSATSDILLNGTVSAENNQIKNVADPTDAQDAVTKKYTYSKTEVDALIANLQQQINEMNQTITSSELEGNWNVKELYYLNPDTNEITSSFPTPECSKPYQYYEFLASKEIFWTGIGTNWVSQTCTSNEFGVKQDSYTITTEDKFGETITYINYPDGSNTRNWEVISRPSENTIIIRAWQNNEITLYNNEVYGLKLVKESRIE